MSTVTPQTTKPCAQDEKLVTTSTSSSGKVRLLTLNRPHALNAISRTLATHLFEALREADADDTIRAVVLTGAGRAFCAGADIKELCDVTVESALEEDWLSEWNRCFAAFRKPLVCAVNGFALGGGAEIAMMADIVHCGKSAYFGLPELSLGTIPGAGGTQRLAQAIGKSRAFEIILTGDQIGAEEAYQRGLVSTVFEDDCLVDGSMAFAEKIGRHSLTTLRIAKQAMKSFEKSMVAGLDLEKSLYHSTFATAAFQEGMHAFLEKRGANF